MEVENETKYLKAFGSNLASVRKSKGFTQKQLALSTDLEISTISRIERGLQNIRLTTLVRISKVLDIDVCRMLHF